MKKNNKKFIIGTICLITICAFFYKDSKMMVYEEAYPITLKRIVLDSGHGYEVSGATYYAAEEEINAKTTEIVYQYLLDDYRFEVFKTTDYYSDPSTTIRRIRATLLEADLLLSIHCNSNEIPNSASGFEIYPQLPTNPYFEESYAFAELLREKYLSIGFNPSDNESGIRYAMFLKIGEDEYYRLLSPESQWDEQRGFGVTFGLLYSNLFPSVLIEQGYVNNLEDVNNWYTDEKIALLAKSYYEVICEYYRYKPIYLIK